MVQNARWYKLFLPYNKFAKPVDTINYFQYCEIMDLLCIVIEYGQLEKLTNGIICLIILLHENNRPPVSRGMKEKLEKLKRDTMQHLTL